MPPPGRGCPTSPERVAAEDLDARLACGGEHRGHVVDDEAEVPLRIRGLLRPSASAMNWSPRSMNAIPRMRHELDVEEPSVERGAASSEPTSRAMWLTPTARAMAVAYVSGGLSPELEAVRQV